MTIRRCPGCGVREAFLHLEHCPLLVTAMQREEWYRKSWPAFFWLGAAALENNQD